MASDSLVSGPLRNGALSSYLASLGWAVPSSGIRVSQFSHGQSNPTFLIEAGSRKVVLRKKPDGELLRSAHAVEREYAIQKALKGTGVPVPEMLSLCEDSQILGTPFYLMEFVDGSVHTNPRLPDHTPQQRTQAYTAAIDVLAKLHSLDLKSLGLEGFGQQLNYCSRQVRRWWLQYRRSAQAAAEPELPSMQQLARLLQQRIPPADADPAAVSVVHGDFRLDNLVFDRADRTCVRAVLDWELSTLGNAMSDVAFFCLPFHLPEHVPVIGHVPPSVPGIPSEQRLLERYCATRGIPVPEPQHWAFYLALSLFRAAAILAGVGARAKHGNAAAANAATVGARTVVDALAQRALTLLNASTRGRPSAVPFSDPGEPSGKDSHTSGGAGFEPSGRVRPILASLKCFMQDHIYPAERIFQEHARSQDRWSVCPEMERLKQKAKQQRLWNLWISSSLAESMEAVLEAGAVQEEAALLRGRGLTNVEYAMCAEVMGASVWASEVFNCSAPDTGNMEVLARYGTLDQQRRWLLPLLRGDMRSCFAMTEPDVASSDATNICATIARVPGSDMLQLDGRKWWISGACDPRCSVAIFMGKSNTSGPIHRQQSMVLVPMPAPGVEVVRPLEVFGFDDAPHGHAEMTFTNVQVPASNLILGEGRGFEIAQGRLGPGRLHHCMRLIGMGERAMLLAATRALSRVAFGKPLAQQGGLQMDLARARVQLAAARLLVLQAALQLDLHGNKVARDAIAAAKVAAPSAVLHVLDTAIQVHGGMGVCQDTPLATMWAGARTLRMADGPDEVHLRSLAVSELRSAASARPKL